MKQLSKMHQRVNKAAHATTAAKQEHSAIKTAMDSTVDPELRQAFESLESMTMPEEPFWDEAQKFYANTRDALLGVHEQMADRLAALMADPVEKAKYNNNQQLAILITSLHRDIDQQLKSLDAIYATHSQFHGKCTSADEIVRVMEVNGAYGDANELYQTLIMPTVSQILEIIGDTQRVIEASREAQIEEAVQQLLDPTITTDVDFKEI